MENTTELAPFNPKELGAQIKDLPAVYIKVSDRANKAKMAAQDLMDRIEKEGVTDQIAEDITAHIKKAKATIKQVKEERTPYTQIMTMVSKSFTQIEADIKDSNDKLMKFLNDYAAKKAEEERKREEEARIKAEKEKELIDVEAELEEGLKRSFAELLANKKTYLNSVLEDMSLAVQDSAQSILKGFDEALPVKELKWPLISPKHTTEDQIKEIKKRVGNSLAAVMKKKYTMEIADVKKELLDKVPSKVAELQEEKRLADEAAEQARIAAEAEAKRQKELAEAKEEERKKLEAKQAKERAEEAKKQAELKKKQDELAAEQAKRKAEEEERLAKEKAEAQKKAEQEAQAKRDAGDMNAMFQVEQVKSDTSVPKGKVVYNITVTHQNGYRDMFALWFAKEGASMEMDKLESMTLKRVREYFEKLAANGEKIESKFVKYKEGYSATVRA